MMAVFPNVIYMECNVSGVISTVRSEKISGEYIQTVQDTFWRARSSTVYKKKMFRINLNRVDIEQVNEAIEFENKGSQEKVY